MAIEKKKVIVTVIAALIYTLTSFSPLFYSLPPYIYVNTIAIMLITLIWGIPYGIVLVFLVSVVNNNMAAGSGIVIYALLTKMFEVLLIGIINWKKPFTLFSAMITATLLIALVKPVNILLYGWLGGKVPLDANFYLYFVTEYQYFFHHLWKHMVLKTFFSCGITWLIWSLFFGKSRELTFNYFGGLEK